MYESTKVTTKSGQEFCTNLYSEEEERANIISLISLRDKWMYLVTISCTSQGGSDFRDMYLLLQKPEGPWFCIIRSKGPIYYWAYYIFKEALPLWKGERESGGTVTCLFQENSSCYHYEAWGSEPTLLSGKSLDLYRDCVVLCWIVCKISYSDFFPKEEHFAFKTQFIIRLLNVTKQKSESQWEIMVGNGNRGHRA